MEKEFSIIANGMNGEGIAKVDGKVFFIDGAVEGDVVTVEVVKENKNFTTAKVKNIIKTSEHRCSLKCENYGCCGGCNLMHINYDKQIEIKTQNIQNLIDKSKLNIIAEKCIKSEQFTYRNKVTLYLTKTNKLGFYERNSKKLIEINKCLLVDEKFNNLINILNLFFSNNKEFNAFILKGISIRQINNKFIINLILNKKIITTKIENYLKLNKINYALYYCVNAKNNLPNYPIYFVGGEGEIMQEEFGVKYPIYPLSFLQVNNQIKMQVYEKILSLVDDNKVVLDAYSGVGLLSAIIAKKSKKVFAVEIDKSASEACEKLAKLNNIKNLFSVCGDCASEVPNLVKKENVDIVVLDPARKGVDENTLNAVLKANPMQIIYLSCNPATLCRDLKILTVSGNYQISFVQPYDMFPNTSEVETLVELKRKI